MFASSVNQSCYWPVIQIIQAPADQRKSFTRKVDNCRSKIELRVQPRLDCVLVGRRDIGEMVRQKRARMTGDELCREKLIIAWPPQSRHEIQSNDRGENDSRGQSQPAQRCSERSGTASLVVRLGRTMEHPPRRFASVLWQSLLARKIEFAHVTSTVPCNRALRCQSRR